MSDFHFIRPLWLLAIIFLITLVILLKKYRVSRSGWHQLIPAHLAKVLVDGHSQTKAYSLTVPFIIGLLTIIALAGPSWQKLPQPVYQVARGSVLIMDMSYSMYSTDVAPNRLTRARYKAIDLLQSIDEGELGLIAYAGDAFVISPLTDDINNIKLLLPSLSPELMPELGSNPFAALSLAHQMLTNAGYLDGDIYWFTDGIDSIDIQDITQWSRDYPHRLNILGVGTTAGAPIKLNNGELMKDAQGAIIIPKLTDKTLKGIASRGRGNYVTLAHNNGDIEQLIERNEIPDSEKRESDNTGDQWHEFGPYLLLIVLPLLLGYFRRGSLVMLVPGCILLFPAPQAEADLWQDLWKTKDQQGQVSFSQDKYKQAAEQFEQPLWQGSAHYKAGDYEQALKAFQQHDSAQALFNQGNALAKMQKLDEAISAYQQALEKDPNLTDAQENKALLEQLKQQQEQQNQNQKNQNENQDKEQDNQEQGSDNENNQQQIEQQQSDDGQQQPQDDQQQSSSSEQSDQQNDSSEQQAQEQQNQQSENAEPSTEEQQEQEQTQQQQAKDGEDGEDGDPAQSAAAKLAKEQQAKETEQKHQQLLNKVTDDPYMLLRNKMQLEYQKRRQNSSKVGVQKKW